MKRRHQRGLYAPELLESRIAPATFIVTSLLDDGDGNKLTLREAIDAANAQPDKDTITFASTVRGEIVLGGTDLDIKGPLIIKGPGADLISINGDAKSRIFNINEGDSGVDSPAEISGLTLRNGHATDAGGDGGAILSEESLTLTRVIVTGNVADDDGGGVYIGDFKENLTIKNCVFTGNTAMGDRGGGIFAFVNGAVLISKSTVTGNHAADNGGGAFLKTYGSSAKAIVVDSSVISGNTADLAGGGLYLRTESSTALPTVIKNTMITGNSAGTSGGGASANGTFTKIMKSTIGNNSAPFGGGLSARLSPFAISGSSFFGNAATDAAKGGGGAIFINSGLTVASSIDSTVFSGNTSAANGGAITASGSSDTTLGSGLQIHLTIKASLLSGNTAANSGGGLAFFPETGKTLEGSFVNLANSVVSGNVANAGAGIYATGGGALAVNGGRFEGNSALYGGGIDSVGTGTLKMDVTVTGTLFTGNSAGYGGAIDAVGDGVVKISGARVVGNAATGGLFGGGGGGGMYLASTTSVSVVKTIFQSNRALYGGGGLTIKAASVLVSGSQFLGNVSQTNGGGIYLKGSVAGKVLKCVVTGNLATGGVGGGIFNNTGDPLDLTGTKVTGNFAVTDPNVNGPVLP